MDKIDKRGRVTMKKVIGILGICILFLMVGACGKSTVEKWQEQYDLGQQYLLEENYEEAIIAFTEAINIEPNNADVYLKRAEAYIQSGETEENMTLALEDYQQVLNLDDTLVDAYLGLSNIYIQQGDFDSSLKILNEGLEKTGETDLIAAQIEENPLNGWKEAYITFLEQVAASNQQQEVVSGNNAYMLLNINGDSVPELFIHHGVSAVGTELCTYFDGSVHELSVESLSFMEGENLFMSSGGRMDVYYADVYCIDNGQFVSLGEGNYGAEDNANIQYDSDGNPIYDYYWNGTQLSSVEEYQELLNEIYDTERAVSFYEIAKYDLDLQQYIGKNIYDYEGIIEAVNNYDLNMENTGTEKRSDSDVSVSGMKKSSEYSGTGELLGSLEFTYNDNGKMSSVTAYDSQGNQNGYVEITYNEQGQPLRGYYTDEFGAVGSIEYEYDTSGNKLKEITDNGQMYWYQYDSQGNQIRQVSYREGGPVGSASTQRYDSQGKLVREEQYGSDGQLEWYFTYEYDEYGNEVKQDWYFPDGTLNVYYLYEYDTDGKCTQYSQYYGDGQMIQSYTYQYDADGTYTGYEEYDSNGNLHGTMIYEY